MQFFQIKDTIQQPKNQQSSIIFHLIAAQTFHVVQSQREELIILMSFLESHYKDDGTFFSVLRLSR